MMFRCISDVPAAMVADVDSNAASSMRPLRGAYMDPGSSCPHSPSMDRDYLLHAGGVVDFAYGNRTKLRLMRLPCSQAVFINAGVNFR